MAYIFETMNASYITISQFTYYFEKEADVQLDTNVSKCIDLYVCIDCDSTKNELIPREEITS